MMEELITCINCPVGCRMKVTISEDRQVIAVEGNNCPRGERYAKQECTMPLRMITAVIPVENFETPLSVKTANPIPKKLIPNGAAISGTAIPAARLSRKAELMILQKKAKYL